MTGDDDGIYGWYATHLDVDRVQIKTSVNRTGAWLRGATSADLRRCRIVASLPPNTPNPGRGIQLENDSSVRLDEVSIRGFGRAEVHTGPHVGAITITNSLLGSVPGAQPGQLSSSWRPVPAGYPSNTP